MDYQTFMQDLQPEAVFRNFYQLSMVPRKPGAQQQISDFVVRFAQAQNLPWEQDEALNVIIRKPASPGREGQPPVMLTAHMDMVCEKRPEVQHDFLRDPLTLIREGDIIRADGTTLGADDGIGMAYIMAILEDKILSHPPIEAVFTTDEESDMGGALHLDYSKFDSQLVLNLDGFPIGCSCTGECELRMRLPKWLAPVRTDAAGYEIAVDGLSGGHTGMEAMAQKGNANTLLARLLTALRQSADYQLIDFEGGNGQSSAFATHAACRIALEPACAGRLDETVHACQALFREELRYRDPDVAITVRPVEGLPGLGFDTQSREKLLQLLLLAPDGVNVFSMQCPGRLDGSSNLGVVHTRKSEVYLTALIRYRLDGQRDLLREKFFTLCQLLGASIEVEHDLAQWTRNLSPELEKLLLDVYDDQKLEDFDGTLECGIFSSNLPGSTVVSLAPTFHEMHSPREHVKISEVALRYTQLRTLLERL